MQKYRRFAENLEGLCRQSPAFAHHHHRILVRECLCRPPMRCGSMTELAGQRLAPSHLRHVNTGVFRPFLVEYTAILAISAQADVASACKPLNPHRDSSTRERRGYRPTNRGALVALAV